MTLAVEPPHPGDRPPGGARPFAARWQALELARIVHHRGVGIACTRLARMPVSRPVMTAPRQTRWR